ncbi:MAG: hypothetical protein NTX49_06545 [Chlamydiae bacterium]|nr:hypothetical protein [Chlamydiota bacterium]
MLKIIFSVILTAGFLALSGCSTSQNSSKKIAEVDSQVPCNCGSGCSCSANSQASTCNCFSCKCM